MADLLSRPLKLSPLLAIRLFGFLIIYVFTGGALLISFKNFSFVSTTWLTGIRSLAFSLTEL